MQTSKSFLVLNRLEDEDRGRFREFVASPYFNKNQELISFYDLIMYEKLFKYDTLDKEKVLKMLYPGQKYESRRVHDLSYRLMNLLEDFLAFEKYNQNSFLRKINLMGLAYEKELEPIINGIEKDIELIHSRNPVRDSNYFYESFMIHSERDNSFRMMGKISGNESLQSKADQLDLFYLALKLKDSCEMLNRSKIISANYDFKMMDPIIVYLQSHTETYIDYPAIQIYLNVYLMLKSENHELYFTALEKLALQYESVFAHDEQRSIYTYIQNYCIRRINQGNTAFYQNMFEAYKHIIDNGLVFEDNKNLQWDFKNAVSIGLRIKEFNWTLAAINAFKDRLPEDIRQNAYTYNLANYYYETGDLKKATKLLNSVEFTDIYYSLDAKVMLLKIYYKEEEEESFYSLVSSFGIFLKRHKLISKDTTEIYENLIRFTRKSFLLSLKLPYQRNKDYYKKVETLKQKITQTQLVANINWLLQEVEALKEN